MLRPVGFFAVTVLMFCSTSYADENFEDRMQQAGIKISRATGALTEAKKAYDEKLREYNKGRSDLNSSFKDRVVSFFSWKTGRNSKEEAALVLDRDKIDAAKNKLDQNKSYLETLDANLTAAKSTLENVTKDLMAAQKEADTLNKQKEVLEKLIQRASLSDKFADLKTDIKDTNYILDQVSMQLDQQLIGVYLQDKMHQLLNSQIFCKAANQCEAGERKPNTADIKFSEMKDIFQSGVLLENAGRKRQSGAK